MQYHNDKHDKEWFLNILKESNYTTNSISTTDEFCHWDIEATNKNGITYTFELKNRTDIDSHKYNDNIFETTKLDASNDLSRSFLVSLFKDCYVVHRLDEPHTITTMKCQRTNNWDKTRILKTIVHYTTDDNHRHPY